MSRGKVIFVIGVSGCGKSTVAQGLADRIGATFLEGDTYHPPENVERMRAGIPLTDEMRWGWLTALGRAAGAKAEDGRDVLVACSGLKRAYRDLLRETAGPCRMLFLDGDRDLIEARLLARLDHYMPASLLDSQLAVLERPGPGEPDVQHLSISPGPAELIDAAARLMLNPD